MYFLTVLLSIILHDLYWQKSHSDYFTKHIVVYGNKNKIQRK